MNFLRTVAQEALKITDKSVDITFASCFQNDVFIVIVPEKCKKYILVFNNKDEMCDCSF